MLILKYSELTRKMYHTQEKWEKRLSEPIECTKDNAWLGVAWYFWYDEDDAHFWGITSKKRTGYYEIYSADISDENVLDTVFNEEHYLFWVKQIEKAQKVIAKKTGRELNLKQLNDYFVERQIWTKFSGIMYQNIPEKGPNEIVKDFHYKKRIQIAVYDLGIMSNFAHHAEGKCI